MKVSLSFHAPVIALFSLLCTMDAAALPPSTPGSVDTTYGTNGVLGIGVRNGYEDAYAIVPMPDGKWLVVGSSQSAGVQDTARHLLRLQPDGRIDTSFGAGGLVYPGGSTRVAAVQASGRIIIADQYDGVGGVLKDAGLRRLLPDGSPDPGFGTGAGATILHTATPAYSTQGFNAIDLDTQGRILGGAALLPSDLSSQHGEIWRFSADGVPDGGFGDGGRVTLDDVAPYLQVQRVRAQPDGKVVVAAWCQASRSAGARACVVRLNSNGSRDATFGVGGVRDIAAPAGNAYYLYDLRIGGDGKIYAAGTQFFSSPPRAIVMRFLPDGTLDAGYGTGGIAALAFTGESAYAFSVHPLADGRQIVFGFNLVNNNSYRAYVARLTAGGQPDSAFGDGGIGALPSTPLHSFNAGVVLADGNLLAIGQRYNTPGTSTDIDTILARFVGVEIAGTVVEFYNTGLNHYFVTADPNEAAAIDNGAAGPGWGRTGLTFKSGGPNRVCRFYGSPDIDPATGLRRGPNSHFYTIETAECVAVKQDIGWRFESYDFNGWPAGVAGCPAGTVAVKRAYNGRFAHNDSNHRYTTSDAQYSQMLAQGWSGEGTVFCAVQ